MNNIDFQKLVTKYKKDYENLNNNTRKPYHARNMVIQKTEVTEELPTENEIIPEEEIVNDPEVGYISVGVYTALGAIPVPEALITIYTIDETGEENAIAQLVSDANGQIPDIKLGVYSDYEQQESPLYYFENYNMRVQIPNYYTVNVLDMRVFPNITTRFKIDLIPVRADQTGTPPEQTIIIPPSPIDRSNM